MVSQLNTDKITSWVC